MRVVSSWSSAYCNPTCHDDASSPYNDPDNRESAPWCIRESSFILLHILSCAAQSRVQADAAMVDAMDDI